MTVLEVVNQILKRLREDEVTALTDSTQAQLLAEFVRDSVIILQDMHNWSMLKQTLTVTTAASDYDYVITGAGKKFKIVNVWNQEEEMFLRERNTHNLQLLLNLSNPTTEFPSSYGFDVHDSAGDPTVLLYPIPDGVYNIDFNLIVPQSRDDLTESTEIKIPSSPVIYLAWSMAISERGEDAGAMSSKVEQQAFHMAADAIAQDFERTGLSKDFYPE